MFDRIADHCITSHVRHSLVSGVDLYVRFIRPTSQPASGIHHTTRLQGCQPRGASHSASSPAAAMTSGSIRCARRFAGRTRSEEHTSELQSRENLVCRLLLEKK